MVFLLFSILVAFFLSWSFPLKTCRFVDLVVLLNFSVLVYALASARQFTHDFMANRWGNSGSSDRLYFFGLETPPTSRDEGLLFLHGLESNPACSLQSPQERSQDCWGVGRGELFPPPNNFIKRAFKRRVNSTIQLMNAARGHQAPRKATQLLESR